MQAMMDITSLETELFLGDEVQKNFQALWKVRDQSHMISVKASALQNLCPVTCFAMHRYGAFCPIWRWLPGDWDSGMGTAASL